MLPFNLTDYTDRMIKLLWKARKWMVALLVTPLIWLASLEAMKQGMYGGSSPNLLALKEVKPYLPVAEKHEVMFLFDH